MKKISLEQGDGGAVSRTSIRDVRATRRTTSSFALDQYGKALGDEEVREWKGSRNKGEIERKEEKMRLR